MSKEVIVKTSSNGIGFGGLLTIVFIVLKLTGYINWSWWWVVSPLWIPLAIIISFILLIFILSFIGDLTKGKI